MKEEKYSTVKCHSCGGLGKWVNYKITTVDGPYIEYCLQCNGNGYYKQSLSTNNRSS